VAWDPGFTTATGWNRYGPFPHYHAALRARGELADWDFYGSSVDQGGFFHKDGDHRRGAGRKCNFTTTDLDGGVWWLGGAVRGCRRAWR
jgi:hypothetical protein